MHRVFRTLRQGPNASPRQPDAGNVFIALLAFRLVNALTLKTFFQPDEYYQALEPAWQIAFGQESGAWITWVNFDCFSIFFKLKPLYMRLLWCIFGLDESIEATL